MSRSRVDNFAACVNISAFHICSSGSTNAKNYRPAAVAVAAMVCLLSFAWPVVGGVSFDGAASVLALVLAPIWCVHHMADCMLQHVMIV